MSQERKAMKLGLTVIICALLCRLGGILLLPVVQFIAKPEVASFLLYLETGRVVKLEIGPTESLQTEPTIQTEVTQPPSEQIRFQQDDAQLVQLRAHCTYPVDVEAMLMTDLVWNLTKETPTVLIVHSHATESYTPTPESGYLETAPYRTLDEAYNMIRVGEELQKALQNFGIIALHDTTLHDYPSYTDAYINSRKTVETYLAQYPTISLVVDLHRDAVEGVGNSQLTTHAEVNGSACAQLMLVVGSNASGRTHPDWEKNMALAVKLHTQLEKRFPGICRPISFRTERFNQDLSPGALLIEVGAAGDTIEDALQAVWALADGIADLAQGTATADSTN